MKIHSGQWLAAALLAGWACTTAFAADGPRVSDAWARATPPGVAMGAAYLTLQGGAKPDRLVGARTDRAEAIEIHVIVESDGMARMRPVESVEIPARATVTLAPKGTHLMLVGLDRPLVAGETLRLELEFAASPAQTVTVEVRPATAGPAADSPHAGH